MYYSLTQLFSDVKFWIPHKTSRFHRLHTAIPQIFDTAIARNCWNISRYMMPRIFIFLFFFPDVLRLNSNMYSFYKEFRTTHIEYGVDWPRISWPWNQQKSPNVTLFRPVLLAQQRNERRASRGAFFDCLAKEGKCAEDPLTSYRSPLTNLLFSNSKVGKN